MRRRCLARKRYLAALQRARGQRFCSAACYHAWQRTPEGRAALAAAARLGAERRRTRWAKDRGA